MATHDHGFLPLTSPQTGVWFAQQLDPARSDYTIGEYLEIDGALDVGLFEEALRRTLTETEALGMRFAEVDGVVRQTRADRPSFRLATADVGDLPDPAAEAEALMRAELARPIDLATGDVTRQLLVRTGPRTHRWLQAYHHIVADGVSGSLLARRTAEVYTALATGAPVPASDAAPWEGIVAEEQAYLRSEEHGRDREFWRAKLADAPEPVSFTGHTPARPTGTAVRVSRDLDAVDASALRDAARRLGTRWSALVMAAAAGYLHRVGATEDVVLGLPVTGRTTPAARRTPGMFSKVLPLRLRVTGAMSVEELVRGTSAGIKEALRHQRYRVEELYSGTDGSGARPWDAVVNLMSFDYGLSFGGAGATAHNLAVGPVDHVSVNVYDRGGDSPLTVQVEGNAAEGGTEALSAHRERFVRFLVALATADPSAPVDSLGLLTGADEERLAVLGDGGSTATAQDRLLHELFEEQAVRTPDAVAVICAGERLSYAELDAWAERIADRLRPTTTPGAPVGVSVGRSPAMVAALLGILKAGCCYVPLDPALPQRRIAYIVRDADIRTAVAGPGAADCLPADVADLVATGERPCEPLSAARRPAATSSSDNAVSPDSAAYLLYTSGSTGEPKGVLVPHAAAADFVLGHLALCGVAPATAAGSGERFLGFASLSFDVSVLDVFGALLSGSALVLATDEERTDVDRLQALLARERVTVADLPPALLPLLDPAAVPALRFLSTGGEAPSGDAVDRWASDGREVWNAYGPTEAAVSVTMHRCVSPSNGQVPPIGRPMVNHRAYVLDPQLRLLPPGAAGELCVAGAGLAHGYAGRPGMTADRFVPDPFAPVPGARMYRTGDLVRWSAQGQLEFLGRIDQQVKVNGHRIELGEIESVLVRHPSVGQASVTVHEAAGGGRRLVAFVAPASAAIVVEPTELAAHLALAVPRYMVPHTFVVLDRLPLTPGGKVDRKALVVPATADEPPAAADPQRPYSAAERMLSTLIGEVLGCPAGPDDNFFELGGDSIAALGLVSRARARGYSFTLREVFEHKTAAALAAAVGDPANESRDGAPGAAVEEEYGELSATPVMRWLLDGPGPYGRFSQSVVLALPEGADDARLVRVLQAVIDHHAALRLHTAEGPEGTLCSVGAPGTVDAAGLYRSLDTTGLDEAARTALTERAADDAAGELDPAAGVMLRAVRFGGAGAPGRLLMCVHHLAVDGVSWRILMGDLAEAWSAVSEDRPVRLAPVGASFRDWTAHLRRQAHSPEVLAQLPFWQMTLAPAPAAEESGTVAPATAPALWDRVPDPVRDTVGSTRTLTLDLPAEVAAPLLSAVPAALRTGPAEILLAALALAARHPLVTGGDGPATLLLDLEGHGRDDRTGRHDLSRTVGWFTTQYPVRLDLRGLDPAAARPGGGDVLAELVGLVRDTLAAVPDHGTGYGLLARLNPGTARKLASAAQPRVLFNYLGRFDASGESPWGPAAEGGGLRAACDPGMPVDHCLQIDALALDGPAGPAFRAVLTWPGELVDRSEAEALAGAWEESLRLLARWTPPSGGAGRPAPRDFPLVRLTRPEVDALAERYPAMTDVTTLSPLQEGLFFHASYDASGVDAYTGQLVLTLDGALDPQALASACRGLPARHSALRAAFTDRGLDRPVQVVLGVVDVPWESADLSGLDEEARERAWAELLAADRGRRFDLERPPLVRFTLVRLGADRHRLVMTNHHILWDGWSSAVLLREVLAGYAAATGAEPAAAVAGVPYRDYLDWLARQDRDAAAAAWGSALAGLEEPTLLGAADPHRLDALPERISLELSRGLTERLTERARSAGITLNSVVQGAWAVLLSLLTGRDDVVFGGTVSGRTADLDGIEELVGLLINTLPVRMRVRPTEPLIAALTRFQDEQARLMDHQHLGLVEIQRATGLGTLFDTTVVVENYPLDLESMREPVGGVRLTEVDGSDATHYTVNLIVLPGERLRLHLDHRPDALDARAARSVADALERLLVTAADEPGTPVGEIDLLSAEQHRLIEQWNSTAVPVPATTLVELFRRQVAATPQAPATVFREERLSYAELDARAERLAGALRAHGAGPERIVAVALHRSTEMVVALLAVLKSGAAYLPVDPTLPADRVAYLLSDARPVLLITTEDVEPLLPTGPGPVRLRPDADGGSGERAGQAPLPSHPAYVIYTSGSTGRPKAVVVEHAAIVNRLLWMQDRYGLGADDRVLQKTPFGFDVSVWEFFWPLLTGAVLVVAEPGGHKDPAYLAELIRREAVTTVHFVPSMLAVFAQEPAAGRCRSLRRVVCSGEALPEELKNRFLDVLDVPLHNLYGPTEAAVDVTHWDCRRADEGPVPIGRPIWNTALYVLDPAGRPVPVGLPGELYLAGAGLARGYLRRPELTAERFPLDPFGPPGSRMYRTGDIVRRRGDGAVEYLGRTDDQVKIHGFRIELGEIETSLARLPGVGSAAVVVREDVPGERRLAGYVVPTAGVALDAAGMRAELARSLPEYMVPLLVVVDGLPVTPNGKLDRKALPAPASEAAPTAHEPPVGETEEFVAHVWQAVLDRTDIGRHDDFFAIGGHSLSATRVAARLRQALGLELPLHTLFEHRTVAGLATAVETALFADIAATADDAALSLVSQGETS